MGAPARCSILFVCTGNTCRSPLAESLCKRLLADRLGCGLAELEGRGFVVRSAGVWAGAGDAASEGAVIAAAELGADLRSHRSRPINPELLADATHVVAMTGGHVAALAGRYPHVGPPPVPLADGFDLPDPIGGELDEYRACARAIATHLDRFIHGWLGT
jgi:L-threonylcarbamoyladenylate synthase